MKIKIKAIEQQQQQLQQSNKIETRIFTPSYSI